MDPVKLEALINSLTANSDRFAVDGWSPRTTREAKGYSIEVALMPTVIEPF